MMITRIIFRLLIMKNFPEIRKVLSGAENIIWPKNFKWFAKSSGTTNDKSKFIPVSDDSLKKNHFKSGKDLLSQYINNNTSSVFDGYSVALGGSRQLAPYMKKIKDFCWRYFSSFIKKFALLGSDN